MKTWRVHELGQPRAVLRRDDVREPAPGPGQVLVRVLGCPINFPDVLLCRGEYQTKPELPFTPGVELCGEVVELGPGVDSPEPGTRVIGGAALPSGGFGQYALMRADRALPAPASLSDVESSAFHIGYQTGWFGLHRRAGIQPGETLLVHAASGGVGSAAIQLGKAAGARVIGVVGGAEKAEVARDLGADIVVDRHEQDFVTIVKEATGGLGADVIYDPVGGQSYDRSTKCIAFEGRIVLIGFASGSIPRPGLNHALIKNYSILGLHWGLYNERDPEAIRHAHEELTRLADRGEVCPLVSETVEPDQLPEAVERVGAGATVGRVVVR